MKKNNKQKYVDVSKFNKLNDVVVKINNKVTDLSIGDKICFPEGSPIIKTVVSMTIFEDGTVNYLLKWFDGMEFKSELVSTTDIKILNDFEVPPPKIELAEETSK